MTFRHHFSGFVVLALLLAACSGAVADPDLQSVATPTPGPTAEPIISDGLPGNLDSVTFIEDDQEYRIAQLLPRDGISPIYEPTFVGVADAPYGDNDLVMGVDINGDARAYSVGILRSREIVNDVIGGTPVLVSW